MRLADLAALSQDELGALFDTAPTTPVPRGIQRGRLLCWLDTPAAHHPLWRPVLAAMFQWTPFGVDFDRRRWFFVDPHLGAGRFQLDVGASRWRPSEAMRLHYDTSALPGPVRALLYDEVKPLPDGGCVGIGGLRLGERADPVFYFGLEPRD